MGIDSKKLKKTLEKHHIILVEYFCIDSECAMIKCFLSKTCEYILIYIPSALRFEMNFSEYKNAFQLEELDENTDNDDYSKSGKMPDMDTIDEEKSVNSYKELVSKYQRSITLDPNDEPISRKLKRQIDRLKQPFKRLKYELSIQNGKFLAVVFDEDITMFSVKQYNSELDRCIMYLMSVNDFIDRIEYVDEQISIIKNQFYDIIKKVSLSNLDTISDQISDYKNIVKKISDKKEKYENSIKDYLELYDMMIKKEKELYTLYKDKLEKETGLKKSTTELEYNKKIKEIYKGKIESVRNGILLASKYQTGILILEETSFDNSIMIERVSNNFKLLYNSL
jgi:hypothetical protein